MKGYTSEELRNVIMLGYSGVGKTTVVEAALAATGAGTHRGRFFLCCVAEPGGV